jgi:hypothetical protein
MTINAKKLVLSGAAAILGAMAFCLPARADDGFNLNAMNLSGVRAASADIAAPAVTAPAASASASPAAKGKKKDWTVMAFINDKNNLGDFGALNVSEMEQVGSTDNMNVVVELGKLHNGSQRIYIQKANGDTSTSIILSTDTAADMGDYKHAIDFVKWAKTNYPARHYMFILWNHGMGLVDPIPQAVFGAPSRGISFDNDTKDYIRTPQMAEIFREAGPVDVFGMNACLMQMAEVDYEVKDYVGTIVGSEETMLAYGFDYQALLSYITANPHAQPAEIGKVLVNAWHDFMESAPQIAKIPGTMSTIDPLALNGLPMLLDTFSDSVMRANDTDAVNYAIQNVVRFTSIVGESDKNKMYSTYGDLYDFVRLVSEKSQDPFVQVSAKAIMDYIDNMLVLSNTAVHVDEQGQDYTKCHGISINLTMKQKPVPAIFSKLFETPYGDLAMSRAGHWADFVAWTDKVWAAAK